MNVGMSKSGGWVSVGGRIGVCMVGVWCFFHCSFSAACVSCLGWLEGDSLDIGSYFTEMS